MAEIIDSGGGGGKGKHQKKRAKKHSARIDMTPMVDLGFLLLTFFVLTSQFSKPKVMELTMPVKSDDHQDVDSSTAMTVLLTDNEEKIYYYYGMFKPETSILKTTDFSKEGIRKILLKRNEKTIKEIEALNEKYSRGELVDSVYKKMVGDAKGAKDAVYVIVKADEKAKYKSIIDVLDEVKLVCNVGKFGLVDITKPELELIKVSLK